MQIVLASAHPMAFPEASPRLVKEGMRERIRAERRRRGPAQREASAHDLAAVALEVPEIAKARCIAAYVSTPAAPGTLPLRHALRATGVRVLLPVLMDDGRPQWLVDSDHNAAPGRQAPSPADPVPGRDGVRQAEVVIVPALAVDTLGNRLGQGGGFYDRLLTRLDPAIPVFAVVHDGEVLDAAIEPVPAEPHDQQVDAIITPHRCLRLLPDRRR